MESSSDNVEEEELEKPSTSRKGNTFIITPDKITKMGLIEQIKTVFKLQVAPKMSQNVTIIPNVINAKMRMTSENETNIKSGDQLLVSKTDDQEETLSLGHTTTTDSDNAINDTSLNLEQSRYYKVFSKSLNTVESDANDNVNINKPSEQILEKHLKEPATVISATNSTVGSSGERLLTNYNTKLIDSHKSTTTNEKIGEIHNKQVVNNNAEVSVIAYAASSRLSMPATKLKHTIEHQTRTPFALEKRDRKPKNNQVTVITPGTFQSSYTDQFKESINFVKDTYKKGSSKQPPAMLKNGNSEHIDSAITLCKVQSYDTDLVEDLGKVTDNTCKKKIEEIKQPSLKLKKRGRPPKVRTDINTSFTLQSTDVGLNAEFAMPVQDTCEKIAEETLQQSKDSTLTCNMEADNVLLEDVKYGKPIENESLEIFVPNKSNVATCKSIEEVKVISTDLNKPKTINQQVNTATKTASNKIHVLSIKPVFLQETHLKQISQSVVRNKNISKIQSKQSAQISADNILNPMQPPSPIESKSIPSINTKLETELSSNQNISMASPKKRGRKRKSEYEKIAAEEVEKSVVLETKRIRKKKYVSGFITDDEYDVAIEMAENMMCLKAGTSSSNIPKKRAGRKKNDIVVPSKSNINEDVINLLSDSDIIDLSEISESDKCNLSSNFKPVLSVDESLELFVSQISSCGTEIAKQVEYEVLPQSEEFQNTVPSDMQNSLILASSSSFVPHQENSCESVLTTHLSNITYKSLTEPNANISTISTPSLSLIRRSGSQTNVIEETSPSDIDAKLDNICNTVMLEYVSNKASIFIINK